MTPRFSDGDRSGDGMRLRTCLATVSLGGTLAQKLEAASTAGFDGVELLDDDFLRSGLSAAEVAARCRDLGLTIELYQPFRRAEGVDDAEFVEVLARFRSELDTMEALGADSILVVSNTDADAIADCARSAAQLRRLAEEAAQRQMRVHFEALAWGRHISTLAAAWRLVHEADHPGLSVVVDSFHAVVRGELPVEDTDESHAASAEQWAGLPSEAVGFLQLADAHQAPKDPAAMTRHEVTQWSRNRRCFPGEGTFALEPALRHFLQRGFTGPVSLEIFNPGYRRQPPADVARRGAEALRGLLERAAAAPLSSPG
ncbi:sugar phosphate isomerase/epimerase family protein [Nesterenkonia populi]